ncbi:MAG: hypothetical protein AB8H47_10740 [Bacteroidia bacterium]
MKATVFSLLVLFVSFSYGQTDVSTNSQAESTRPDRLALSIGLFHGGGSLAGVDLEFMATDRIGLQMGVGYVGFGAGLNYHLKPTPRSSAIALVYWHQGFDDGFAQSALGTTFLFRGKKILTAQLGVGYRLRAGNIPERFQEVPVLLLYSLGIYLCRSGFTPKK